MMISTLSLLFPCSLRCASSLREVRGCDLPLLPGRFRIAEDTPGVGFGLFAGCHRKFPRGEWSLRSFRPTAMLGCLRKQQLDLFERSKPQLNLAASTYPLST